MDRRAQYGITGTPSARFDAVITNHGAYTNDNQMYSWYLGSYNTRMAVPTYINIEITAEETDVNKYEVVVTATMDAGGVEANYRFHIVKAIDYYPSSSDDRYRNCLVGHREVEANLSPEGSYQHIENFSLSSTDINHLDDLKFVAFVENDNAAHEVQNSEIINYPFPSPDVIGDVDGDGDVDLADLAGLLATYGLCDGDVGYNEAADFEDNDCIDLADLAALLSNYGYGV